MSKPEGYYKLGRSVAIGENITPMCLKVFLLKSVVVLALASRVAGFGAQEYMITDTLERES